MPPAMAERTFRVAVLASGGGTNLQALLDACTGSAPARVVLVLSNNPEAGALQRAEKAGVPSRVIGDPRDGRALNALLDEARPDLVVLAGYLKLVPSETVAAYAGRMINIHPALLPAFGGPGMYGHRVHEAVIASGARKSGASIHLVTAEYDRGPVIAQEEIPVNPGDTAETLAARVLAVEHRLLPAVVLAAARKGKVVPASQ
jgi:phosphoribosylglycinamide formyltransferase 1